MISTLKARAIRMLVALVVAAICAAPYASEALAGFPIHTNGGR